jgi:hypothetical protein
MGGNEWQSTGPYRKDLATAFRAERERELAMDDHGFPGRDIADLWEDRNWQEYILTEGRAAALPLRGRGTCTVLYRDGAPVEIGYWGCTAD